jgi:putative phosphoesterase
MFIEQALVNKELPNLEVVKTVGVISDTHVPKRARCIPKRVFEIFEGVNYIIHAGDLVELAVIDALEQIAPVLAVRGNSDGFDVANALPKLNTLKVFDWKIGVMHDQNILEELDSMGEIVNSKGFDVYVYGHTHFADIKWKGKALYINPGSPTDLPSEMGKPTVGLLKITQKTITAQIVEF